MTLYEIYSLVNYISGKFPSGGTIPPSRFNSLLVQVQDEYWSSCISVFRQSGDLTRTPLIAFKHTDMLTLSAMGGGDMPADYGEYIVAHSIEGGRQREVAIIGDVEFGRRKNDVFTRASVKPFARIDHGGIWVVPYDTAEVTIDYFSRPATPYMDVCQSAANPALIYYMPEGSYMADVGGVYYLYDVDDNVLASNVAKTVNVLPYTSITVELEWPTKDHYRFVYMILSKVGINIGEKEVAQYAMQMSQA